VNTTPLDEIAVLAETVASEHDSVDIVRQKSNVALVSGKQKLVVMFGTRSKLRLRSRFFTPAEKVTNETLLMANATDAQVNKQTKTLIQRAQKEV